MADKFELYKDKYDEYRFRLRLPNGEVVGTSEGYKAKESAQRAIESVKINSADAQRFTVFEGNNGKWYFNLKASSGEIILQSMGYSSEQLAKKVIDAIQNEFSGSSANHRPLVIREHDIFPDEFPESWASDWGEDEYGLFMGFTYKGVRQDFRWIEPGTFLMGSPAEELGRTDSGEYSETQHEVTLSKGFWLADTVVTQALWEVVMGTNPSNFDGQSCPVDSVSWKDTQEFIARMNQMKPELRLCLPSEAEWEYCCRSGTDTPFYLGGEIDSDWVNFDGSDAYNGGRISGFRKRTIDVKSLPPNAWGLYEMHGNVLEWCNDWLGAYSSGTLVDPNGAKEGVKKVLRGGSWIARGKSCRSANRNARSVNIHRNICGFRLARA